MCIHSTELQPARAEGSVCPEVAELQSVFEEWMVGRDGVRILEAGCGSASYLCWAPGSHITGMDISQKQLDRNETVSEKIRGDIQTYQLPPSSYDVIICWDVLEHLPHPELAIKNFVRAIRPDGLIILAFPNVVSVKGLIAKFTPHWFHVWVYRHFLGIKDAGKDDTAPFKTFLRFSISPRAIRNTARRLGMDLVHVRHYQTGMQKELRSKHRIVRWAVSSLGLLLRAVSLGRIDGTLSDCIYVLRRSAAVVAPATVTARAAKEATYGARA